jgi:hypothetical protein
VIDGVIVDAIIGNNRNETLLYKQSIDLFFSIKHRVVEGYITEYQAQEMREYFRELYDWY